MRPIQHTFMLRHVSALFWVLALLSIVGFWYGWEEIDKPSPEVLARGKSLYHSTCAPCHGKHGAGDGPIAANLKIQPRNLVRGVYENRSTMSGQLPTKEDLFKTLSEGIHNTAMLHFRGLRPEDRLAVIEYIRTLSPRFADPDEYPLDVLAASPAPEKTQQALIQGRKIYVEMKCGDCHGATGKGEGEIVTKQVDEHGELIATPDLTDPASYEFSRTPHDLYRILSTGLDGSPMPSYFSTIKEQDRWYLAYYVWSLREGSWTPL